MVELPEPEVLLPLRLDLLLLRRLPEVLLPLVEPEEEFIEPEVELIDPEVEPIDPEVEPEPEVEPIEPEVEPLVEPIDVLLPLVEPDVEPIVLPLVEPPVEPVVVWAKAAVVVRPRPRTKAAARSGAKIWFFIEQKEKGGIERNTIDR